MSQQSDSSGWILIDTPASAGAKSDWFELIAVTTFATTWMVFTHMSQTTNGALFIDLAIGDPGSEVIILDDQYSAWRNNIGGGRVGGAFSFPMTVPEGSRISVRMSDTSGSSENHDFYLTTSDETMPLIVSSTVNSSGLVDVFSDGPGNDFGLWHEMIDSTTEVRGWMVVSIFKRIHDEFAEMEIGLGPNGLEGTIWKGPPWFKRGGNQNGVVYSTYHCFPVSIPIGTRISARVKDDDSNQFGYRTGIIVT